MLELVGRSDPDFSTSTAETSWSIDRGRGRPPSAALAAVVSSRLTIRCSRPITIHGRAESCSVMVKLNSCAPTQGCDPAGTEPAVKGARQRQANEPGNGALIWSGGYGPRAGFDSDERSCS